MDSDPQQYLRLQIITPCGYNCFVELSKRADRCMADTTVLYDITPYHTSIRKFHAELVATIARGNLAIARIFQILPVQVVTQDGQKILEHRGDGSLKKSGDGSFVSAAATAQDIIFLDDALGKISVHFPSTVKVQLVLSGNSITLTSIGEAIEVNIPSLPEEIMSPPVKFVSFVVGDDFMQTHIIDRTGAEVLIDGKLAERTNEFLLTKDMLLRMAAFTDTAECLQGKGGSGGDDDGKKDDGNKKKYMVWRQATTHYCRIITPGMAWGSEQLGEYDTLQEAQDALQRFVNDGVCGESPVHE